MGHRLGFSLDRGGTRVVGLMATVLVVALTAGCGPTTHQSSTIFPPPDDLFITSGDGDIQAPYTPVGQLIYSKSGYRIPLPILGLVVIADVDPDQELRNAVVQEVRAMGGDGLINMEMIWTPPHNGWLGFGASGGTITIYGTVIQR